MQSQNIVPIVTTSRLRETRAFYVDLLGFEVSFEHDHYLGVRAGPAGSAELGFMRPDADAPGTFGGLGMTFGIRVADADLECERLRTAGARIVQEPADMPWGARAFATVDPNGVALYVSHPIPATPEFAACVR
ncbi:MAG TPA: VOC family protein [Planctomycetota bacterium]|nr:VOC family protein [Planctomycetota bacterium]